MRICQNLCARPVLIEGRREHEDFSPSPDLRRGTGWDASVLLFSDVTQPLPLPLSLLRRGERESVPSLEREGTENEHPPFSLVRRGGGGSGCVT